MDYHPLHPASPDYKVLAAAGRTRPLPWPYKRLGCPYDSWPGLCGEPIAGTMRRTDIPGAPLLRACRQHLVSMGLLAGLPMRVTWRCSVCLRSVDQGYRLDGAGRCLRCQP